MKIAFCGAASGVTGSCHMISTGRHKILLDCGQFQGGAAMEAMNRVPFPFDPEEIECVVVSHAHIDHIGRLPLLVKQGFQGPIYCTDATSDLMDVMLKDSAHIHEQEAEWKARKARRAGREPEEPLYTTDDALAALELRRPVRYDTLVEINDQMKIVFNDAGHILGSAVIELWTEEGGETKKLVFSGDLGMNGRPILNDPVTIHKADVVVMETTYGNRLHEQNAASIRRLLDIVVETTQRGGNVVIPSFAVGRTQELIFELNRIYDGDSPYKDLLRNVQVFVDSPMAVQATEIFKNNAQDYDEEMREFILQGDHPLDFRNLHFTMTSDESKLINTDPRPKIIISASGMCEAGRIRHHLKHNLFDPRSSVVFVGYQAEGTLGRTLIEGAREVKLFGDTIAVKAQIHNLEGFSGHADRDGLYAWLSGFEREPGEIFLVHGEPDAKRDFAAYVKAHKGWNCIVVNGFGEYDLSGGTGFSPRQSRPGIAAEEPVRRTAEKTAERTARNAAERPAEQRPSDAAASAADSAVEEFVSENDRGDLLTRLRETREMLDSVLRNLESAAGGGMSAEKLAEIKNLTASLEMDVLNLGSAVTEEDRPKPDPEEDGEL
ncbi:MAG: MBL fold metallo-hydrolase [Lachnospiraceae bacterium]|nr:MBL fold metallo-hydrolase [Lachnospiraceae bacterium]